MAIAGITETPVQFILTAIVSSLGILVGIIVAKFAKQEAKQGQKYFKWLCILTIALIAATLLRTTTFIGIIISILFIIFYSNLYVMYVLLGASLAILPATEVTAILTFIYGLPAGTMLFLEPEWKKKAILGILLFIVTAIVANFLLYSVFF